MRGLVTTTAVLGVLAIGGLPALALTLAAEETGPDVESTTTLVGGADHVGKPPPWAQGHGPGEDRDTRPGVRGGHDEAPHGWAVRQWAHCLADAARDREPGERLDSGSECGGKPVPPGHAKRQLGATAQAPGQQERDEPPGRAGKPEKTKPEKTNKPDADPAD